MNTRITFRHLASVLALGILSLTALRASAQDTVFVHWASAGNTIGNTTYLDSPVCNSNPKAALMVTPSINPFNQGNVVNAHHTGVWYDNSRQRWAVFNEDGATMPSGSAFNVWAYRNNFAQGFVQQATGANVAGKYTYIDNPYTNGNPNAVLYVTQLWNPFGFGGTYNNNPIGVFYDSGRGQWAVMNTVSAAMPVGAAFFVFVDKVNLHQATPANTFGSSTLLDDSWSQPWNYVLTFVTANVSPNGVPAGIDPHPMAVQWIGSASRWSIINADGAAMPLKVFFNTKQQMAR
jgi:hypothetical protein